MFWVLIISIGKHPYHVFLGAIDHVDLRRYTVSLPRLRSSSGPRNVAPRAHGWHESHAISTASERLALVLLLGCPPTPPTPAANSDSPLT
jgi:hypothetical protein